MIKDYLFIEFNNNQKSHWRIKIGNRETIIAYITNFYPHFLFLLTYL